MTTTPPLLIDMPGIARLAGVRRPVVSMWRKRFGYSSDPFPAVVAHRNGTALFDGNEIAGWLTRTEHGNNGPVSADLALDGALESLDVTDAGNIARLEALIVLSAHCDDLTQLSPVELIELARQVDQQDEFVGSEINDYIDTGNAWSSFAVDLVDAAYSTSGALDALHARHRSRLATHGTAGSLGEPASQLVEALIDAVATRDPEAVIGIDRGTDHQIALQLAERYGDRIAIVGEPSPLMRATRRRFHAAGIWPDANSASAPVVRLARVPVAATDSVKQMVTDAEAVLLSLREEDTAIVIGPVRALTAPLPPSVQKIRDDALRSGRLRGVVRLPRGLVSSAAREAMALWVLGPPTGGGALDPRVIVTADLLDHTLTAATQADLVSDLIASRGTIADVHARTFRFASLARTSSLLARSAALIAEKSEPKRHSSGPTLAALLDVAAAAVGNDVPATFQTISDPSMPMTPGSLTSLISEGHVRLISGARLANADLQDGSVGLIVVTAEDLTDPMRIGQTRIDQLTLAQDYPSAKLTKPGDIIICTGPTAAAWVDSDGAKVVAYPARVLRVNPADPGGLMPEVIAADVPAQRAGPGAWKRWTLRRVHHSAAPALRSALTDLSNARADLTRRIAALDTYTEALTAAVAAGAVTLTSSADQAQTN